MRRFTVLALMVLGDFFVQTTWAQFPAFSGAEGPGANATGGRGGDVYHVTNLEFDNSGTIPGSFRYGVNNAPAAGRTIVFDVGGTIFQNGGGSGSWFRSGKSNITIAGQTAPGPGITIAGVAAKFTGNNNIIRNITVRPNKDPVNPTSFTYDAFSLQLTNSIVDHVSASWYSDEGISSTDAGHTTTVQYALINEGLNYNGHSFGSIISTEVDGAKISYHHNLYAHNNSRMPRLGSEMAVTQTGAVTNFSNNVLYNWPSRAGYSGTDQPNSNNFLGNYYIRGNNNGSTIFLGGDSATNPGVTKIYHSGNLYDGDKDGVHDGTAVMSSQFTGSRAIMSQAFNVPGVGTLDTATQALQRVLDYGGANWQNRNPIESRIIQSVRSGTGALINDLTSGVQLNEWSTLMSQTTAVTRDANWDTDQDGMPDYWEQMNGTDAGVANNNADFDSDGYTDLEEYINELGEWPAPVPIVYGNGLGNGRYANIKNWVVSGQQVNVTGLGVVTTSSNWQPSKFDEAQINSGTVTVDAVGQHAGNLKIANGAADTATLNVSAGWLDVANTVTIGSTATSQGTVNLSGGILRTNRLEKGAAGQFNMMGGVLAADEVAFSFTNNGGVISPGNSPGETHVIGDLTMSSGSIYLEISGNTESLYDQLQVDGTLNAGGTLNVALMGYSPVEGDSFDLLDFGSLTGVFAVSLPSLNTGLAWDVSAFETTGTLSVIADIVENADFDGDGDVDGGDFLIWQRGFGLTAQEDNSLGDANGDGDVNEADLAIWHTQYAEPGELVATQTAVPEPGTVFLGAVLATFMTCRRR